MTVLLCIDFIRKSINWNYPFLPRVGEKLFTADFFPSEELTKLDDYLMVTDVIWHIESNDVNEYCVSLVLDYPE